MTIHILVTAKQATSKFYKPFILGSNILYLLFLFGLNSTSTPTTSSIVWTVLCNTITWGLQYFAYVGILEHAANNNPAGSKNKDLVGGVHLDLLGLTMVVQYLSVLHSRKWFSLLLVVPAYALWSLYNMYKGGANGMMGGNNAGAGNVTPPPVDPAASASKNDKREKRAQKRANKWK